MITRSQSEITDILISDPSLKYSDRLVLGIEHYIAGLPPGQHASAWQKLPFMVQFAPIAAYLGFSLPDIRYANPGIYYGGLTEYDKDKVYAMLNSQYRIPSINYITNTIPSYQTLQGDIHQHKISFPMMIKANKGERGVGIYYIANEEILQSHREKLHSGEIQREPCTVQQYIDYKQEYCLQFYQYQDEKKKDITQFGGLTLRDMPYVTGDGKSTVEELINASSLSDEQKQKNINFLQNNENSLLKFIPGVDEYISIVRTASLDFGVKYVEVSLSSSQEKKIITIIQDILINVGPHQMGVGRFDIKAQSLDDLLDGRFYIIEMNAVGGIPTHVYDEKFTITEKYDILRKHFSLVMKIAENNKENHIPIVSTLIARPEFLRISLKSFSKKGISFRDDNPQKKHIKSIYNHILSTIQVGRKKRWYYRISQWFRSLFT